MNKVNSQKINVEIYKNDVLLERYSGTSTMEFTFNYEMFDGNRYFDYSLQVQKLLSSQEMQNSEEYSLYCTFVKFGNSMQERADFTVTITKE